jgi:ubiquinone/menaquinone biosynthesis C-methylase UbiE
VQALPFANKSFPSLLSTFPTDFIMDPVAIAEFQRVLQPGGVFVCVPVALITSPVLLDRLARWLFAITGQSSEMWFAPVAERYNAAGFSTRVEQVRLPSRSAPVGRSVVTVIVAEKSPKSQSVLE